MNPLKLWKRNNFRELVHSAYQREDDPFSACPRCGDLVEKESFLMSGIQRETRCTHCGYLNRRWAVEVDKTEVRVNSLPFEFEMENINSSGGKLLVFIACRERCREVAG